jgi:hypothetical protein
MKRNNITQLILIVILALLTACEDALNTKPLDKFSGDLVWADANTARSFVNDTYGILGMMIQDDDWSDNMVLNPSQSFASNLVQENFTNETNFSWNIYGDIRKCNMILEKLAESDFPEKDKNIMMGEAYFLRATAYFSAARKFGNLMIVDRVLTPEDDLELSRSATIKETYDFILKDLDEAAKYLPESVEKGRAGKGAAYALKAEVALQGAAYLSGGDKSNYYQQGIKASEDLFALNAYALDTDYRSMFNTFSGGTGSAEIILAQYRLETNTQISNTWMQNLVPNMGGDKAKAGVLEKWPLDKPFEGWLEKTPSQEITDAYLVKDEDGKAKRWNETTYYQSFVPGESSVYNTIYTNRDKRFYANIVCDSSMFYTSLVTTRIGGNINYLSNVQQDRHMTKSGYVFRKGIYEDTWLYYNVPTNYHYVILRLGRSYLNYAELQLRMNGANGISKAVDYINMTRTVHGALPALENSLSLEDTWEYYKIERRADLLQENDRYWSLLRWGKEESLNTIPELNSTPTAISISEDGKNFEIITVPVVSGANSRRFTSKRYLLPVPRSEIVENSNLNQNPGWE